MDIVSEQKHDLCLNPVPKILYLQKEEIIMKDQVPGKSFSSHFVHVKGHIHTETSALGLRASRWIRRTTDLKIGRSGF